MQGKGEDVCIAWCEYAMMKAGLQPWDMPIKHYQMFAYCYEAEAKLQEREEKKADAQKRLKRR